MTSAKRQSPKADNSLLLEHIQEWQKVTGRSARWFGLKTANDPRLVPNLARGHMPSARVRHAIYTRLVGFFEMVIELDRMEAAGVIRPKRA